MAVELYSENTVSQPETLFASDYPHLAETGVVLSGEGVVVAGTVMGQVTASGKWRAYASGNADGSEVPYGIMAVEVDATSADVTGSVEVAGHFRADQLTGYVAGIHNALRDAGIHVD